jgi:pyruvate,water dikinase
MSQTTQATALVLPFEQLRMTDVEVVGGKNASLGEMISQLGGAGVRVPGGFATTAHAFREFLREGGLTERIDALLTTLDVDDVRALTAAGAKARQWVMDAPLPAALEQAVREQFARLTADHPEATFAVRSSATAEDLPDASFAGQQETFLNVDGIEDILHKMKDVFASLYNDRAISYRVHKGFAHTDVALSAGVQRMVRSDIGAAGVMFTIDTESGFEDVVFITSSYGLGETVVQGAVNPDEFYVHKPMLSAGKFAPSSAQPGQQADRRCSSPAPSSAGRPLVKTIDVPRRAAQPLFAHRCRREQLAKYALMIEQHYGRPMDIEWGKDGQDGQLYILQARPETVKSQSAGKAEHRYKLKGTGTVLVEGRAIGQKIGTGPVRMVHSPSEMDKVQPGRCAGDRHDRPELGAGHEARLCHRHQPRRAHLPRGHHRARTGHSGGGRLRRRHRALKEGVLVTVSCAEGDTGFVYDGLLETEVQEVERGAMPEVPVKIMMNVGNPQLAFDFCQLPNAGVGLARLEFIINNNIGVHPKAILDYPNNVDADLKKAVESVARGHASPRAFYVDRVAEGVATIAAAFWPKPVIVRLSDFKSNEYRKLIGGSRYEPDEENPMLGFRGASALHQREFGEAFAMECEA